MGTCRDEVLLSNLPPFAQAARLVSRVPIHQRYLKLGEKLLIFNYGGKRKRPWQDLKDLPYFYTASRQFSSCSVVWMGKLVEKKSFKPE